MTFLYWIHDSNHEDITKEGYVGVTESTKNRFLDHKRNNKRIPKDAVYDIIFEGSRKEAFELEYLLRPSKNIGWNNAVGGKDGWRHGFSHTEESKRKMKSAWNENRKKAASNIRKAINKSMIGQKREKQSLKMRGSNNPMFGKSQPQHVKEAVSKAHKNKSPHNYIDYFCILCRNKVSPYSLNKYHGFGKKNCISKEDYDKRYVG